MLSASFSTTRTQTSTSQTSLDKAKPVKFGFLTSAFSTLEANPMFDLAVKDVACYMVPQVAIARSKEEVRDMLPNSIGLLVNTVASMMIIPQALRAPVAKLAGLSSESLKSEITNFTQASKKLALRNQSARLAVAFGFLFPFLAIEAGLPFVRNLMTLKRTGTTDFEQLIGLKTDQNSPLSKQRQEEEKKRQIKGLSEVLGAGFGLGALALLGFSMLARRKAPLPENMQKTVQALFRTFALGGKKSYEVRGMLSTMIFWLLPPYLGWILAARSKNERIEHTVKGANSALWFSLMTPLLFKPVFMKKFENLKIPIEGTKNSGFFRYYKGEIPSNAALKETFQKLALSPESQKQAMRLKNWYSVFSWLLPVTALALTPQLLNIHFTKKRFEKTQQQALAQQNFPLSNTSLAEPSSVKSSTENVSMIPPMANNPFLLGAAPKPQPV